MQHPNSQQQHSLPERWSVNLTPIRPRTNSNTTAIYEVIGDSKAVQNLMQLAARVAPSESTVLLLGETGTGKELIAKAIHMQSPRRKKPMVIINCGALPVHLIESELFGHEKGSFTGAIEKRIGKFELASGSTLFLDEIGEMPPELQVKLLRVIQEKEVERIGGNTTIPVDVRIIAATNRNLEMEMQAGRFRPDLYYRLHVFPITVPPLRERFSDIPALAAHFLQRYCLREGKNIPHLPPAYLSTLINYHWPGNIRELENLIARSVVLSATDCFYESLPGTTSASLFPASLTAGFKTIAQNEAEHIIKALIACNHKINGQNGAAALLQINASTLLSRMKKLGIQRKFSG